MPQTSRFIDLLRRSNLISGDELELALAEAGTDPTDASLAERLVDEGRVTRWQADQLLTGRCAFFLGRYRLLEPLGRGGMGAVFKAEQMPLARTVALKLVREEQLTDDSALARFRREIRIAAALSHPNVVAALDADCANDRHFLVMEYVDGVDLGTVARKSKSLPVGNVCEWIRQAALGLQHAFEHRMVHRDVKPGNILLVRRPDQPPVIKILDFGLAKFESETAEAGHLTGTGQIMGTPDYVAPEQASDTRSADIRSDIFSLGCTLYRLLAGVVPFPGSTVMEKLMARATRDVEPLCHIRADVPPELDAVVMRMLARDPESRYQTPADVAEALAPFARWSKFEIAAERGPSRTEQTKIDPELLQFLNALATEAAIDEDGETILPSEAAKTLLADDEGQPVRMMNGTSGRTTRLQRELAARNRADRRRLMTIAAAGSLSLMALAGALAWYKAGETTLVVEWNAGERAGAVMEVDGHRLDVPNTERFELPGRPGRRSLTLDRHGYERFDFVWDARRGASRTVHPDWVPLPETVRVQAWATLQRRLDALDDDAAPPDVNELWKDLVAFSNRWKETPEAAAAFTARSRVPGPLDVLNGTDIPPDLRPLPETGPVVALLGDPRLDNQSRTQCLAISPDGALVAAGTAGNSVELWEIATGRRVQSIELPGEGAGVYFGGVYSIAFHPSEDRIVVGSGYNGITFWNPSTGEVLAPGNQFSVVPGRTFAVAYNDEGTRLATAHLTGTVSIGELKQDAAVESWQAHDEAATCLAFSHDGDVLATGGADRLVKLWDVARATELHSFSGHEGRVNAVSFSPDDTRLASAALDGTIRVWDIAGQREERTLRGHSQSVTDVDWSADGRHLASASRDGSAIVWNARSGEPVHRIVEDGGAILSVIFSSDLQRLVTAGESGRVRLWNVSSGNEETPCEPSTFQCAAFSPDRSTVAAGDALGRVWVWDPVRGTLEQMPQPHAGAVSRISFTPGGETIVTAAADREVRFWNVAQRKLSLVHAATQGHVAKVTFTHDGSRFLTMSDSGMMELWDSETGARIRPLDDPGFSNDPEKARFAFSWDGLYLAGVSQGEAVIIWTVETGRRWRRFTSPESTLMASAFSDDGRWLAVGGEAEIVIWNLSTSQPARTIHCDGGGVHDLQFSADGRLISRSWNGAVRGWNLESRGAEPEFLYRVAPRAAGGGQLAISPDSRYLTSTSANGVVFLMRLLE